MKFTVLGRNGFIGSALYSKLQTIGQVYNYLRPDVDVVFHFASPSSKILFNYSLDYSVDETISSFLNIVRYCREYNIKLVYPSSATIYTPMNSYAYTKKALENIHLAYGGDILGLRIFAGYGVGEEHKGEYASIVYKFCKEMINDERPSVFEDGSQTRDFIYIDDIVDTIINNLNKTGIIDVGTGVNTTFNKIINLINKNLNKNIKPVYIGEIENYPMHTVCKNPIKSFIPVEEGIKKVCDFLKSLDKKESK